MDLEFMILDTLDRHRAGSKKFEQLDDITEAVRKIEEFEEEHLQTGKQLIDFY